MHDRTQLAQRYAATRAATEALCKPLCTEDYVPQPMADVSPPRWHLGHTTWFFERFVLSEFAAGYKPFHADYGYLFNSYYNLVGERTQRSRRGVHTRPTVAQVHEYRHAIDALVLELLRGSSEAGLASVLELGLNHEQQHQELLLADIKNILWQPPMFPVYSAATPPRCEAPRGEWYAIDGGRVRVGHAQTGFAYDNEGPAHDVLLRPFRVCADMVTNAQWLAFMRDGGYRRPQLWLADGWDFVSGQGIIAPLYWVDESRTYSLHGVIELDPNAPVAHISYYEAEAFARWAGKRLPTEFEWEHAARVLGARQEHTTDRNHDFFNTLWQWSQSAYVPYPGFKPVQGPLGEYNGKFMVNQMVLRGSSVATPRGHSRVTYRNFWHPDKRWQFTGLRLAEDA
ncbi:MAG: ergothioneine biosynthesis protein EgtB [Planctomycetes bacterium]|nr:ergothioneine biosynthesis protein EgtB [Planctomycetota bacterium]MCW8136372.1 ergothioneine biosynthesis protein EgtB [Planctomycetota bacterium]